MSRFARYPLRHRRPVRAPHRPCVLITIIAALFIPPGHVGAADAATARTTARTTDATYHLPGLDAPAEIIVDTWGVPHIYAGTHYDAFVVQGFNAARDRLWQRLDGRVGDKRTGNSP